MTPRWTKVLRDAAAARGRLSMIVAALAASIAAVATMLSAYTVLTREVPLNYLGTGPASAQLELAGAVSGDLLDEVRRQPNIAMAEAAATVTGRIEVGPDEWMPMLVFVMPDIGAARINSVRHEAGAWPPPTGVLVIERSALALTRSSLGHQVTIELPASGRHSVPLATTVHDPGVAPAWQEQTVYAYATPDTLRALGENVKLDLLKLVVAQGGDDASAIDATVRRLAAWLHGRGVDVNEARIPPPRRHPHQGQMNAVLAMLLTFSMLALLLGAVLTATVIGGLLAQQVRQIAIMKAIGARSSQIGGMVLGLVAVLGCFAVLVGVPLGVAAGRGFVTLIAGLLNLRIESMAPPGWVFTSAALMGVAVPVLAACVPVWSAVRRTVRDAMDDHGVSRESFGRGTAWRALARVDLRSPGWTLAVRNMFRRRARLVSSLLLLAGAGAMLLTSLELKAAWERNVEQSARDRHYDAEISLQEPAMFDRVRAVASAVPGVKAVEPWSSVHAAVSHGDGLEVVRRYPDGAHGGFALRAAAPDTAFIAHEMLEGRWLGEDDADAVVINGLARSIAFRDAKLGDEIVLEVEHRPVRLKVVGIVRELLTPGAVYVTPATFSRVSGLGARDNAFRVTMSDRGQADAVAQATVRALERAHLPVAVLTTERRFVAAQGGHVYVLVYALGFIAAMMAVVGLLGMASSLGTSVIERTREFGVLRALGARGTTVAASVIGEGMLTGALGWFAGLVLSWPLAARVAGVLGSISVQDLTLRLSMNTAFAWLAAVLAGAAIASFFPARRASQLTVRETLSHS